MLANNLSDVSIDWHTSMDSIDETVDYLLIKLPKSSALLEDQLYRYRNLCTPATQVIAAGMVKYMTAGVFKLIENILGPTRTSLAKKRARLIFCEPQPDHKSNTSPYPLSFQLENTAYQIENHANVFSRESLDIGTRFLLGNLPEHDAGSVFKIADLGCGNGIVGLLAAAQWPEAEIDFYDESFMALASARSNFERAFPARTARFIADDCMACVTPESYQLILCNPPFHQHNVVGDFVAQQMFRDAKNALLKGGELRVVGNRHLGYRDSLRRLFGHCRVIAQNNKFVVLKAIKR